MTGAALASGVAYGMLVGLPAVAVVTRLAGISATTPVAVLQDLTPLVLVLAWIGLIYATVSRVWPIVVVAALLAAYHVGLIYRLARRRAAPRWVPNAPQVRVAVANVYIDNADNHEAAEQLAATSDVLVVVETSAAFRAAFDAVGGHERFPSRVFDEADESDYAVSMYASNPAASL